jgi:hypothetical protein
MTAVKDSVIVLVGIHQARSTLPPPVSCDARSGTSCDNMAVSEVVEWTETNKAIGLFGLCLLRNGFPHMRCFGRTDSGVTGVSF